MRTRARSPGSGPGTNTTRPSIRPTACPFASKSVKRTEATAPGARPGVTRRPGGADTLRRFLLVEGLDELVRLVDERLDAIGGLIAGLLLLERDAQHEERQRGRCARDAQPHEGAAEREPATVALQ